MPRKKTTRKHGDPSNVSDEGFLGQFGLVAGRFQCWDEHDYDPIARIARGILTATRRCHIASMAYDLQTHRLRLCTTHRSAGVAPAVLHEHLFRAGTHWANTRVRPDPGDRTLFLESGDRCCVNCPHVESVIQSILLEHCAALDDDDLRDVIRES